MQTEDFRFLNISEWLNGCLMMAFEATTSYEWEQLQNSVLFFPQFQKQTKFTTPKKPTKLTHLERKIHSVIKKTLNNKKDNEPTWYIYQIPFSATHFKQKTKNLLDDFHLFWFQCEVRLSVINLAVLQRFVVQRTIKISK